MTRSLVGALAHLLLVSCASPPPFTDEDLANLVESGGPALIYTVSDAMPLSLAGVAEIHEVATRLDLPLVVLLDSATSVRSVRESIPESATARPLLGIQASKTLRGMGMDLHYPSLVIAEGGLILDAVVPGYKTAAAYEALVIDALGWPWEEEFRVARSVPLSDVRGEFFKPVHGTSLVAVGWSRPGYLFDLANGETTPMGDGVWGDAGVTPDGQYLTIVFQGRGLRWFSVPELLRGSAEPLLEERGLHTYQSMGLLDSGTYRVLVAETSSSRPTGLLVRDYRAALRWPGGEATIDAVREWTPVCDNVRISLPMLSRGGRLVSGMSGGTTRVFRIEEPSFSCTEAFDTGRIGGKAEFSRDDSMLVFVSSEIASPEASPEDVVVQADLRSGATRVVYRHAGSGDLWFPAFLNDDEIVVFDRSVGGLSILERRRRVVERMAGTSR